MWGEYIIYEIAIRQSGIFGTLGLLDLDQLVWPQLEVPPWPHANISHDATLVGMQNLIMGKDSFSKLVRSDVIQMGA